MIMKKIFFYLIMFLSMLNSFGLNSNFNSFVNDISGLWYEERLGRDNCFEKFLSLSGVYEFSPYIVIEKFIGSSYVGIEKSPKLVFEEFVNNFRMGYTNEIYLYDDKLDLFYRWNGSFKENGQKIVIFDSINKTLYSFQLNSENLNRIKEIKESKRQINLLSDSSEIIVKLSEDSAIANINKFQWNFPFRFRVGNSISKRLNHSLNLNLLEKSYIKDTGYDRVSALRKDLIDLFGKWDVTYSDTKGLIAYINFNGYISLTYVNKQNMSNVNREVVNFFYKDSLNGNSYYYYVPFENFRVYNFDNGIPFILYKSERWIMENELSRFKNIVRLFVGIKSEDGSYIFYTTKNFTDNENDLFNFVGEYKKYGSLKDNLEIKFKIKFDKDKITSWLFKDGLWVFNLEIKKIIK